MPTPEDVMRRDLEATMHSIVAVAVGATLVELNDRQRADLALLLLSFHRERCDEWRRYGCQPGINCESPAPGRPN